MNAAREGAPSPTQPSAITCRRHRHRIHHPVHISVRTQQHAGMGHGGAAAPPSAAALLRCDFDSAKGRTHLFRDCPVFAKKITLIKRIIWFVEANGKPKASASYNHAWFVWDHQHQGPATIAYAS
jgi:hypothetical protein